jgi:hypothetical protein
MNKSRASDAIVDEVRRIRRQIVEEFGHDLDQLAAELKRVESDYAHRRGIFGGITREAGEKVVASWGPLRVAANESAVENARLGHQKPASKHGAPKNNAT